MSDFAKDAWRKYLIQLQAHPLRTKAITAGVLSGCSDAIAQKISGVKQIQFRRLLLLMLYGLCYGGPFGHYFHKLMDAIFKGKKDNTTVAKKVLLEQLTSSPWNNFLFMSYYGLVVEGRPWKLVKQKVGKDYRTIQLTAWKFWPIVGWINYQYVPLQFRVLFGSFIASCWSIFLNLKTRRERNPDEHKPESLLFSKMHKSSKNCILIKCTKCINNSKGMQFFFFLISIPSYWHCPVQKRRSQSR